MNAVPMQAVRQIVRTDGGLYSLLSLVNVTSWQDEKNRKQKKSIIKEKNDI